MSPSAHVWTYSPYESGGGMDFTASYVLSAAERVLPVITAAAPTTALLIKKLRRSTPGGTSSEINAVVSASGSSRIELVLSSFVLSFSKRDMWTSRLWV